jgi:hypothetical protein
MPVRFDHVAIQTMGRPLCGMAHLKRSIVEVKTPDICLAHAIITISKVGNSNYKS